MTDESQSAGSTHNHAPRCCCGPAKADPCPACPEHGELAPPAGHHLVHSEAFIDQDDPRGPRPVDRPECGHPDWPDCPHPQHQRPLR